MQSIKQVCTPGTRRLLGAGWVSNGHWMIKEEWAPKRLLTHFARIPTKPLPCPPDQVIPCMDAYLPLTILHFQWVDTAPGSVEQLTFSLGDGSPGLVNKGYFDFIYSLAKNPRIFGRDACSPLLLFDGDILYALIMPMRG